MGDVGNIDAFAERARRDDARQLPRAERPLDAGALIAGEARVVEGDRLADGADPAAEHACEGDGLLARVHIDDALASARYGLDQMGFAVLRIAEIDDAQVVAHGAVDHDGIVRDAGEAADLGCHLISCGCGHCEDGGFAEGGTHLGKAPVCTAVARFREAGMVRLVDHDESHAPRLGEAVAVDGEEFGCGQDDIGRTIRKRCEDLVTLVGRCLAREHRDGDADLAERFREMEGLVGHESAQRIDEDARLAHEKGRPRRVEMEDERLSTAGRHDAEAAPPPPEQIERRGLSGQEDVLADHAPAQLVDELGCGKRGEAAAQLA